MADRALGARCGCSPRTGRRRLPGQTYAGERPRRLHDHARGGGRSSTATPTSIDAPVQHRHDGDQRRGHRDRLSRSSPTDGVWTARRSCSPAGRANVANGAGDRRGHPVGGRQRHAAHLPVTRPARRRRGARRRRIGHRRAARRRDPPQRAARSRSPSASTCGCRAPTAAATSSGGWRPPACSTSATTRSTTSSGPATSRRRS